MQLKNLPVTALPAWSRLNNIIFQHVKVYHFDGAKCNGVVSERALSSKGAAQAPTLITVPHKNLLSVENIQDYARVNPHFRELLELAGSRSLRIDVMLYLLLQISTELKNISGHNLCLSSPWTEYVMMLPKFLPVPTMWRAEELQLLIGTSLEAPVDAKLSTLQREFENFRQETLGITWCRKCWWETGNLNFQDWLLLDAWYRSRIIELPDYGEALVPCLDMINHSSSPNAYYERTSEHEVSLLLRPNIELEAGSEITINYGAFKSEAEMLYSYGFIDQNSCSKSLTLPLNPPLGDPLSKAKLASYSGFPNFQVFAEEGSTKWRSSFAYFICLNEEDGLEFKTLQQVDGTQGPLKVFWQGSDVSSCTENFESYISNHALCDVFQLRVVTLLQDQIHQQLERLNQSQKQLDSEELKGVNPDHHLNALRLRASEKSLLKQASGTLEKQKILLLKSDVVVRYLSSFETALKNQNETTIDEDDFS